MCLLKHRIKGEIELTERRGRTHKQLLDCINDMRRYWKRHKEALDRTLGELAVEVSVDLSQDRLRFADTRVIVLKAAVLKYPIVRSSFMVLQHAK